MERGAAFLASRQGEDGLWRDFLTPAGEASLWPTGFIGAALLEAGVSAETAMLRRAVDALTAAQDAAGGWGYNEDVPHDADSTACALLFLAQAPCSVDARQRAVACLQSHQRPDSGGIATYREPGPIRNFMGVGRWMRFGGWCQPHLEVTAATARALAALGPETAPPALDTAWRFVRGRQRADGSWASYWWTSPHYATLQGAALALAMGDERCVRLAGDWALGSRKTNGAWSLPGVSDAAFATALGLSILVKAQVEATPVVQAVRQLAAMQDADGGWPSDPIMRIPLPGVIDPDRKRAWLLGRAIGFEVADQHRTFTTAACVSALAAAGRFIG